MNFLLSFPDVLLSTSLACDTVNHIRRFAGDGVSNHKSFVGRCYRNRVPKCSKFAGVTSFVTAFVKTCFFWCGFLLGMTQFVMNHLAFSVFEEAATLLTLVVGGVYAGWWWLWVDWCVAG